MRRTRLLCQFQATDGVSSRCYRIQASKAHRRRWIFDVRTLLCCSCFSCRVFSSTTRLTIFLLLSCFPTAFQHLSLLQRLPRDQLYDSQSGGVQGSCPHLQDYSRRAAGAGQRDEGAHRAEAPQRPRIYICGHSRPCFGIGLLPAVYMLMELAAGGDLFDKIGTRHNGLWKERDSRNDSIKRVFLAPDVGVGDDIAHYYFTQLASGLVRLFSLRPPQFLLTFQSPYMNRPTYTARAFVIVILSPRTSYLTLRARSRSATSVSVPYSSSRRRARLGC